MWLHVPGLSESSISAPDTADGNSPSDPWFQRAPSAMSNGTLTPHPFSWRGWQKRGWIRLLSGLTSPPSTVKRGVAGWMSSLPDSHANRSRPPAGNGASTTSVGCGLTLPESSVTWNPATSSWRTYDSLFNTDSPKSSTTLPISGLMRNGVVSRRPPLAPRTVVTAGGAWPTPRARDDQRSPEAHLAMKARMGGRKDVTSLTVLAKMWPTPRASDGTRGSDPPHGDGGMSLKTTVLHNPAASHLDPTTTPDGTPTSPRADLNPRFVAALMGLPWDWLIHSTSAETGWSPNAGPKQSGSSPGE